MPGTPVTLGPFTGGLHNSAGTGEFIKSNELFDLKNLEVDTDGSLANRPALFDWGTSGLLGKVTLLGTFTVRGDRRYIVVYDDGDEKTKLINAATGFVDSEKSIKPGAIVQYRDPSAKNAIYIVPFPDSGGTGGYFDSAEPPLWHDVSAIPEGQTALVYNDRMWLGAGIDSSIHTSRLVFSAIGDFTSWDARDYIDVVPGNGQKLTSIRLLGQDLMVFKEHSTFRTGYSVNSANMEVTNISRTIGTPSDNSVVIYDNNNIYLMHDNSVYEVFNFSFSKISDPVRMEAVRDSDLYDDEIYGLTLFRDRLFVRYYGNFYVYSLTSSNWSRWETDKKFSYVFTLPIPEGEIAFANSSSKANAGRIYKFTESRTDGVHTEEDFECSITTKTYDFTTSYAYKVLFWWAADISTLSESTGNVTLANASRNPKWSDWKDAGLTWQDLYDNNVPWSSATTVVYSAEILPELGGYGKKILKFPKKLRFRQLFFTLKTKALPNSVADSSVRIYGLTAFVSQKERVVRRTT